MQQVLYDLMPSGKPLLSRGLVPEGMTLVILVFSWNVTAKSSHYLYSVLSY